MLLTVTVIVVGWQALGMPGSLPARALAARVLGPVERLVGNRNDEVARLEADKAALAAQVAGLRSQLGATKSIKGLVTFAATVDASPIVGRVIGRDNLHGPDPGIVKNRPHHRCKGPIPESVLKFELDPTSPLRAISKRHKLPSPIKPGKRSPQQPHVNAPALNVVVSGDKILPYSTERDADLRHHASFVFFQHLAVIAPGQKLRITRNVGDE